MFFPSFPFSKKSGLFLARLVARNFTRALGTPSARLRMGRATRDAVNAKRCQCGRQLTQMAVKGGGGHYHRQPSLKEADRNIVFHTQTMTNIRHEGFSHHEMGSHYDGWFSWSKKGKQYHLAWAVIPVFWLAGYLHSSYPDTNHLNSRGMWP